MVVPGGSGGNSRSGKKDGDDGGVAGVIMVMLVVIVLSSYDGGDDGVTGESVVVAQQREKGYVQPVLVRTCHSPTCAFTDESRTHLEAFECTQVSVQGRR